VKKRGQLDASFFSNSSSRTTFPTIRRKYEVKKPKPYSRNVLFSEKSLSLIVATNCTSFTLSFALSNSAGSTTPPSWALAFPFPLILSRLGLDFEISAGM